MRTNISLFLPSFWRNLLCIFFIVQGHSAWATYKDTTAVPYVTVFSNAYLYPKDIEAQGGDIHEGGLIHWTNQKLYTRIFFYPRQTGDLMVFIRLNNAENGTRLLISLDSSGENKEITINKTKGYTDVAVGHFLIKDSRYHFIEIKGLEKSGNSFPDIESLLFTGEAAKNLLYNTSPYRGAPSTHLRYQSPEDSIAWFYTEVSVPLGVNAVNAYYETNGFADGYMGIQINSPTERRFIFSIWSNFKTDDPKMIPADYAVKLIKKGKDVFTGEFGNEGSGGHSHLVFPWKNGVTYKLLVGAKPAGDHTVFTAYYFAPENGDWRLIAQWDKAMTGGKLLSKLYAFVENFGDNGNDFFKAYYGNQWVCTSSGIWKEVTKCSLTTTASPLKHPRFDYGAGMDQNRFYMFSGGFTFMNNLAPSSWIQRQPSGVAPLIDFSALPKD